MELSTEPLFSSEAQEAFVACARVYAPAGTTNVGPGAEGVYVGHLNERLAVVDWDTPSGIGWRESVPFTHVKNLYR